MDTESDYEVGFGRPPKHSQFKPGRSGNPKGRPKKRKTKDELFEEAWQSEVTINGKKMTRVEAFVLSLMLDGIKGKASARNLLMAHLPENDDEPEDFDPAFDDEVELAKIMRRFESRKEERP